MVYRAAIRYLEGKPDLILSSDTHTSDFWRSEPLDPNASKKRVVPEVSGYVTIGKASSEAWIDEYVVLGGKTYATRGS